MEESGTTWNLKLKSKFAVKKLSILVLLIQLIHTPLQVPIHHQWTLLTLTNISHLQMQTAQLNHMAQFTMQILVQINLVRFI